MDLLRWYMVLLLALPLAGAVAIALAGSRRADLVRRLALGVTLANIALTVALVIGFSATRIDEPEAKTAAPTFAPELVPGALESNRHQTSWRLISFGELGAIEFFIGLDGLNIWLVALTSLLMLSAVLVSWTSINDRVAEYYAWLLVLGTGMLGVFLAFDVILFYVFFELTLVPLFFLIGIWGGPERRYAARKFFIYTLAGSVITLLGILAVVAVCYQRPIDPHERALSFSIPKLVETVNFNLAHAVDARSFWYDVQFWVFLALIAGFAIKVPLVPFHTWLPLAHVEAPTAGSVLLAGVLLKIGAYGFLRLCLPLTPDACWSIGVPLIGTLAVIGILYGAFCALAQDDIKKLVAYSSVSHLGFCMLGMFALNAAGLAGSVLQMINHGLSTGALFIIVGMLYERYHTRKMSDLGGLGARVGLLTFCMVFISLSSVGLPGLNGFVGEALCFFGMFDTRPDLAIIGSAGIVLGAWYLLTMVKRVFFGPVKEPGHEPVRDMQPREWAALGPIMALCLILGIFPQLVLDTMRRDVEVVAGILRSRAPSATNSMMGNLPQARPADGE